MDGLIYKIVPRTLWQAAQSRGQFAGAPIDVADGFIHFSTAAQVAETAARHFAGQGDLLLVAVETAKLGAALKWEVSRGGAAFPHLYGLLAMTDVVWAKDLPVAAGGTHDVTGLIP